MPIDDHALRALFDDSLTLLLNRDASLLEHNVNERTICGRLAIYFDRFAENANLEGYYADIEYNRNLGAIKTIVGDAFNVIRINCDLILHSRGRIVDADNLIAVEVKKFSPSGRGYHEDRTRLRALTKPTYDNAWEADGVNLPRHVCRYRLGVFLEVNRRRRICAVEYYKDGDLVDRRDEGF